MAKDKAIIAYCTCPDDEASSRLTRVLRHEGYDAWTLEGGLPAWRAARDGTVIGSISRNLPSQAVMGLPNIEADPRRFLWLGATSFPGRICVASGTSPIKTAADVFSNELIVGSVGARRLAQK